MKYVISIIILALLKEAHPLNPEILKYDEYMKDFEIKGRQIKQEAKNEEMDRSVLKRDSRISSRNRRLTLNLTKAEHEFKFVENFGNDPEKSGRWEIAYDSRRYDIFYLKNMTELAHWKVFKRGEDIKTALVVERELHFRHHTEYKPMKIDVVRYTIYQILVREEEKPDFYHLTKGLGPDSLYFLEVNKNDKQIVYLRSKISDAIESLEEKLEEELKEEELSSSERNERSKQNCIDLKTQIQNYNLSGIIDAINNQWEVLYPNEEGSKSRNKNRHTSEEKLNKILQDCGLQTKIKTPVVRYNEKLNKTEPAGEIDIRTLDQKDANVVIKYRYKKPACGALRQLVTIVETKSFSQLYSCEKVIAFALNFKFMFGKIIKEWIGLLLRDGEILDAKHEAKCLYSKEFANIVYRGRPVVEYFGDENSSQNSTTVPKYLSPCFDVSSNVIFVWKDHSPPLPLCACPDLKLEDTPHSILEQWIG